MTDEDKPTTLLSALLKVQAEATKVKKTATNPAFKSKYVTLEALMDTIMPILSAHGLVWTTFPEDSERGPVLRYELTHVEASAAPVAYQGTYPGPASGAIGGTMPLLIDKQNPQGMGSALTYARRQSLMAVVGIVGEVDDDANQASQPRRASEQPSLAKGPARDMMSQAQLQNMWRVIAEAPIPDEDKELILAAEGITSATSEVSIETGRAIRRRLEAATSNA